MITLALNIIYIYVFLANLYRWYDSSNMMHEYTNLHDIWVWSSVDSALDPRLFIKSGILFCGRICRMDT